MKPPLTITLVIASFMSTLVLVLTQPKVKVIADLPPAPRTGSDDNPTGPGGTRPVPIIPCQETNESLTALKPPEGKRLTVSEYPTFWFYVPYASDYISSVQFLLENHDQSDSAVYRTKLKLSNTPGIISISLPTDKKYSLKPNNHYHWFLKLDCKPKHDESNAPDFEVEGYVKMVAPSAALESQLAMEKQQKFKVYQENDIWYDALSNLAGLHFTNPQSVELSNTWADLLKSSGLAGLAQKPMAVAVPFSK